MRLSQLKPGLRLEIKRHSVTANDEPAENWQVSQLLDQPDDTYLYIAVPIDAFRLVNWPLGSLLDLAFVEPDRGLYTLRGKIIEQGSFEQVAYYRIEAISGIKRHQRRRHFRLDCTLDLDFQLAEDEPMPCEHAVTREISGGGASFISDEPLPKDAKMKLRLQMEDESIEASGRIIRCQKIRQGGQRQHVISLQFTDLSDRDQDKLIQYIFQRQNQRLAKQK